MRNNNDPYTLIIGSSNMDLNIYSEKLPQQGETVTGGIFKQSLGGKGANQAVASARSGTNTKFIGKIGNDPIGEQMIAQLNTEGIDISALITDSNNASGVAFILIDKNGENIISVAPGANSKLTPAEIRSNSDVIRNAGSIAVQMEIPIETISEIYKIAGSSKKKIYKILNPAPLRPIPLETISNVDILVPNEGELFQLCSNLDLAELQGIGDEKIIEASEKITKLGVDTIITTLGPKGCILYQKNKKNIIKFPAFKVKAVDTVGAGDSFIGVLAGKMAQKEMKIEDAVCYAISASSIAVTRKGAQASMPYADEIKSRFKDYKKTLEDREIFKN